MARPRNDQPGPSARERMENVFWDLLAEKPFAKISVADIAKRAHVNRNALYYHFDNMSDLARASMLDLVPFHIMFSVLPSVRNGWKPPEELTLNPDNERRFEKLRLLFGPHSSHELTDAAQEIILSVWLHLFEIEKEDLTPSEMLGIDFVMGGMFEIIGKIDSFSAETRHPIQLLWSSPVVREAFASIAALLEGAKARKAGFRQPIRGENTLKQ